MDNRSNPNNQTTLIQSYESTLRDPGDHHVDVPIICVLTRFGLRHPFQLVRTYLDYRHTLRKSANTPGLLRSAFFIENLKTCYNFSIWSNFAAIPAFNTAVPDHIHAARGVFGRMTMSTYGGPELWSTKWQLSSVSNNLNWQDFDLRAVIVSMNVKAED